MFKYSFLAAFLALVACAAGAPSVATAIDAARRQRAQDPSQSAAPPAQPGRSVA